MTITRKVSLIAAAAFVSALALPRATSAQGMQQVFGSWSGVVTYGTTVRSIFDPTNVQTYLGSGPGSFTISRIDGNYFEMEVVGVPYVPFDTLRVAGGLAPPGFPIIPGGGGIVSYTDVIGPTSASGAAPLLELRCRSVAQTGLNKTAQGAALGTTAAARNSPCFPSPVRAAHDGLLSVAATVPRIVPPLQGGLVLWGYASCLPSPVRLPWADLWCPFGAWRGKTAQHQKAPPWGIKYKPKKNRPMGIGPRQDPPWGDLAQIPERTLRTVDAAPTLQASADSRRSIEQSARARRPLMPVSRPLWPDPPIGPSSSFLPYWANAS